MSVRPVRRSLVVLLGLVVAALISSTARAADPIVSNQDLALDAVVHPSSGGDTSSGVHLVGVVHTLTWIQQDSQGNCHIRFHANADGISGTGIATGGSYLLTGASAVAYPPDPCVSSVAPKFIFTLNPIPGNPIIPGNPVDEPPDPCDVSFGVTFFLESGQISVSITDVSVPLID